jgi:ABC-type transport system substrate-binding protein
VDLIYDVPRESAALLEGVDGVDLVNGPVSAYQAVTFLINGKEPYTIGQDPLVREAVAYAIDRKNIVDTAFDGRASESQTIIPASILGQYAADVKVPNPQENGRTGELIQAQLKDVGIELSLVNMPDEIAYDNRLTEQQGDLWLEIGNQNSAYPCFLPSFLYYGGAATLNNYQLAFNPKDFPELNEALDDCAVATSSDQAARDAATVMRIMIDQSKTALPLLGLYRIWGMNDKVGGFVPPPVFIQTRWEPVTLE